MKKIAILLLLFTISLFANIGKISAFSGDVKVDRNTKLLNATVGFILEQKDTVKTSDNAKAQIVFEDGTVISIGKNAILNINEFINDTTNPKNSKVDVKFAEGAFKTITGGIGKVAPDRFKLQTKSASIGIRGTIIYGNQQMIACTQGEIEVEAGGVRQILPAGTMTKIQQDGTPTDPEPIENDELGGIEGDVESGSGTNQDDGTNPTNNTEGEESQDETNQDDSIDIEPLSTENESQNQQPDASSPSLVNTLNLDNVSQTINNDTNKDSFQNAVNNTGNTSTLPEPFSFFDYGAGGFYIDDLQYGDGLMFESFEDADVNFEPLSFDTNGNILSKLTIINQYHTFMDEDNVTLVNFNTNDDVHWGYWATDMGSGTTLDVPLIVGIRTPVNIVEDAHTQNAELSFSGKIIGNVLNIQTNEFSSIKQDSFNSFIAYIDFGNTYNNLTGTIQFNDNFNNQWKGSFIDGVDNLSYFSGNISNNGSSFDTMDGQFSGNIYGSESIEAIGGGFSMNGNNGSDGYRATGVFKAEVQ
jgi:hypothetical protein